MQDLVLLGGGHAHAIALRLFGITPLPGVRLTLISENFETAYSGMLPGHVAGIYSHEGCHIDLNELAKFAKAQVFVDQAIGLDLQANQVFCGNHPPLPFDVLSIDIGSTPHLPAGLVGMDRVIPAKPVHHFLEQWRSLLHTVAQQRDRPLQLGIVGGGAGGVELALNMQRRLQDLLKAAEKPLSNISLHLLHRGSQLLPRHPPWVGDRVHQIFEHRGIQLHLNETVHTVKLPHVRCVSGFELQCDYLFWVTQATAPKWLGAAGLAVNDAGFLLVDNTLRSLSHPHIFAVGDIATMVNHPRPKAGVFAVRQGKPLVENFRRLVQGQPLKPFHPQKRYLSLIGTADDQAIAVWGKLSGQSKWFWQWKDHLDRQFMQRFKNLPDS
ncbi:FAD-dependent oxidoreductase [Leptolyngbyaceae cyanobacterium UHCC 1019]